MTDVLRSAWRNRAKADTKLIVSDAQYGERYEVILADQGPFFIGFNRGRRPLRIWAFLADVVPKA